MNAKLKLSLFLASTLAAACLLFDPLQADGPCFEVAPMTTQTGIENAHPGAPRNCNQCRCGRDRICPCGAAITNIYRGTIPTARNCTNSRWRCADDFDLVRNADGTVKQKACGAIHACSDVCVKFNHNGTVTGFVCSSDDEAETRKVYASVYVLTGRPCPNG